MVHTSTPYVHIGMVRADAVAEMAEAMRTPAEVIEHGPAV
jgi:hypothetical protein